eukprot:gene18644-biopygen20465
MCRTRLPYEHQLVGACQSALPTGCKIPEQPPRVPRRCRGSPRSLEAWAAARDLPPDTTRVSGITGNPVSPAPARHQLRLAGAGETGFPVIPETPGGPAPRGNRTLARAWRGLQALFLAGMARAWRGLVLFPHASKAPAAGAGALCRPRGQCRTVSGGGGCRAPAVSSWIALEVEHAAAHVAEHRGVVDLASSDHIAASFGAVRPCLAHRQAAARAAWGGASPGDAGSLLGPLRSGQRRGTSHRVPGITESVVSPALASRHIYGGPGNVPAPLCPLGRAESDLSKGRAGPCPARHNGRQRATAGETTKLPVIPRALGGPGPPPRHQRILPPIVALAQQLAGKMQRDAIGALPRTAAGPDAPTPRHCGHLVNPPPSKYR